MALDDLEQKLMIQITPERPPLARDIIHHDVIGCLVTKLCIAVPTSNCYRHALNRDSGMTWS